MIKCESAGTAAKASMKKCKFTSVAKIRYLLTALLILTGVTSVYGAEVSVPGGGCSTTIIIRGAIQVNDDKRLLGAIAHIANGRKLAKCSGTGDSLGSKIIVWLDSEGGDVDVALDMGRIIRRETGWVRVDNGQRCFSSCVFLLAAGVQRWPFGDVGIHRPYFVSLSHTQDAREVRAARDALIRKIRAYFGEMDIPQSLLDLMLSIPPEKMKVLNESELESFRLSVDDPTHNEMQTAKAAYHFNITSAEYRKRDAHRNAKCAKYSDDILRQLCKRAIMINISVQELQKREDKVFAVCDSISNTLTEDQYLQCIRNILILGK